MKVLSVFEIEPAGVSDGPTGAVRGREDSGAGGGFGLSTRRIGAAIDRDGEA